MDYIQFLDDVQQSGCFTSRDETEGAVSSVLMAMAQMLPAKQLDTLSSKLPAEAAVFLRHTRPEPDPLFDSDLFLGWVVSSVDATGSWDKTTGGLDLTASYSGEEAVRRAQCVFSVLKESIEPHRQQELAALLPDRVDGWFLDA